MRVILACDHGGYELKTLLAPAIAAMGHEVVDGGCHSEEAVDYPDYAYPAADAVASGAADAAILICGTGIGMSLCANRVPGIRAAAVTDADVARLSREHNNSNVLCLGGRIVDPDTALDIVRQWLTTPFSGDGRHVRRLAMVHQWEDD